MPQSQTSCVGRWAHWATRARKVGLDFSRECTSLSAYDVFEPFRTIVESTRHRLGVDRAVAFTVLARVWASGSGLITIVLIARFLSPAQQGYYYTFSSLIALQMVFELGFSQVVMQLASHEHAHLSIRKDGTITGDNAAQSRLASILQISTRWYGWGALLLAVALLPSGLYFFSTHQQLGEFVSWRLPWIATAMVTVLAFQIDPLYSFLEGCGFVAEVAHVRWMQAVAGSLFGWTALGLQRGLYAPAAVIAGQVLVAAIWLTGKRHFLCALMTWDTVLGTVSWRHEIWPFQWRIAVSWVSGYFVYQTFNPFLFAYRGPVEAGRMGMSLSFANALMFAAMAWISTKAAPLGTLIAQKRYVQLDSVFFRALKQSLFVAGLGATLIWLGTTYLHFAHSRYAYKLLSPLPFALLLVAAIFNHVFAAIATYLRAHKQEKLFYLSLAIAVAVLFSNYYFAKASGAVGMVAGYLVIIGVIGMGCGALLFSKYRREWHSAEPIEANWISSEVAGN